MNAALHLRTRAHRQRHVLTLACQPFRQRSSLERCLARIDRIGNFGLQRVDRRTKRLALLRRQLAELRHQFGNATLLADGRNAHGVERREIGRLGDLLQHVGFEGGEI